MRTQIREHVTLHWLRSLLVVGGLLAGLTLCACGSDAPKSAAPTWHEFRSGFQGGLLLSVWGHSPDDVWVVGGRPGATAVLHGNRDTLSAVDNPGQQTAWWVCGLGNRVAIVGEGGLVMIESSPGNFELIDAGIDSTLYGCWGSSIDDFWVVGGNPLTGPAELAQVHNRQAIAPDLGPLVAQLPKVLFKVTGVGDELVIVGANSTVLWRDANGAFRLENAASSDPLFTVSAVSVQNIWAVGGTAQALALHFDGQHWADKSPADLPNLFGVSATRSETIVGGNLGALAQWQSGKWQIIDTAIEETFHSVWLDGHGGAWAVGGNVLEPNKAAWRGVIWQR